MTTDIVFPRRNLNGDAEPWGRAVETNSRALNNRVQQVEQTLNNYGRGTGSQLSVLSRQVNELVARGIQVFDVAGFTVTGNATVQPFPVGTRQVFIPGTGVPRSAMIQFYGSAYNSVNDTNSRPFLEASFNGGATFRAPMGMTSTYLPAGWNYAQFNITVPAIVPADGGNLTLLMTRIGFNSTTTTWTIDDGIVSVQFGDRV